MSLDTTHDPALRSWVTSANADDTDFPIQNLPFGRFRRRGRGEAWRTGIAIGDQVLDLKLAASVHALGDALRTQLAPLAAGELNRFMAQPPAARVRLRRALSQALAADSVHAAALAPCLVAQAQAELGVPCHVGDYTDFYTGIHHATAVGKLFRPDQPLLPNYAWVPIGYHGRSSSIGVSGQQFKRPMGQTKGEAATPVFGPSQREMSLVQGHCSRASRRSSTWSPMATPMRQPLPPPAGRKRPNGRFWIGKSVPGSFAEATQPVSYTHLRAHET